jgi:hypothetical protein
MMGACQKAVWAILIIVLVFLAISLLLATSFDAVAVSAWIIVFSRGFQLIRAFRSKGAETSAAG